MERKAGGNLAAPYAVSRTVQRRYNLAGYRQYPRYRARNRTCAAGAVLCRRRGADLRQPVGNQTVGGGLEAVYPVRPGARRSGLRAGADDGAVYDHTGPDFPYHDHGRNGHGGPDRSAVLHRNGHRGMRISGIHSPVGGHAAWRAVHYGAVLSDDSDRIRAVL